MPSLLRAYLETNVYVEWDRVPGADQEAFEAAVQKGLIVAPPSLVEIEEILGPFEWNRDAALRPLALIRRLVGYHGMLKTPSSILQETIVAYADGTPPRSVALPEAQRANVVKGLADVLAGSIRLDTSLVDVVTDVRRIKNQWRETMLERQERATTKAKVEGLYDGPPPPFSVFWRNPALSLAEAFAERHGRVEGVKARGIEGILEMRPIRLGIGVVLSQIYSQLIPTETRPQVRAPRHSDGYDVWHAILAGTADVFVTFDERLAEHVEQVPDLPGFRVVTSIGGLLELLC